MASWRRSDPFPRDHMREDPFRVLPLRFYGGAMGNMRAAGRRPRRRLLPQGACPAGMRPPFSFRSCPKRKRAVHGPKEKGAWRAPVQWPSARDGGRRIGASADFAWPSGTLDPSARSILPSRGGWCRPRRGARTHLTRFSFRAFRFATRYPGDRGALYQRADEGVRPYGRTMAFGTPVGADALIGPLQKPHQLPGQRQRKEAQGVSLYFPGPKVSPRAARFRP